MVASSTPTPLSTHFIRPSNMCWVMTAPSTALFRAGSMVCGSDAMQTLRSNVPLVAGA